MPTILLGVAIAAAGCGGSDSSLPTGAEQVALDPAEFTTEIDNPYWPMTPGSRWVYRETDGHGGQQRVVVMVTNRTTTIMGIAARVVRDVVTEDGAPVEATDDWYAQDGDGNVWYLGEDTKEYEHGKVASTEGSWRGGVDGAQPGIIVPARPVAGLAYREEYYAGHAEDAAQVLALDARATVPYGTYDGMLQTRNTTPLEPDVVEEKLYARGLGPVLTIDISGGAGREELVAFNRGG